MEVNFGSKYSINMPPMVDKINLANVSGHGMQRVDYQTSSQVKTGAKDLFITELRENLSQNGIVNPKMGYGKDGKLFVDTKVEDDRNAFFDSLAMAFDSIKDIGGIFGNLLKADASMLTKNLKECYKYGFAKNGKPESVDLVNGAGAIPHANDSANFLNKVA